MDYLRSCTLAVLLALAASCGDDAPESKPDASDAKPDASDAKPDASDAKPDASHARPDASDTTPDASHDASDAKNCPESGEPAVAGCPCKKPRGFYCCGVGYGMSCGKDMIWNPFDDSPCTPEDEDAGPMIECRR